MTQSKQAYNTLVEQYQSIANDIEDTGTAGSEKLEMLLKANFATLKREKELSTKHLSRLNIIGEFAERVYKNRTEINFMAMFPETQHKNYQTQEKDKK